MQPWLRIIPPKKCGQTNRQFLTLYNSRCIYIYYIRCNLYCNCNCMHVHACTYVYRTCIIIIMHMHACMLATCVLQACYMHATLIMHFTCVQHHCTMHVWQTCMYMLCNMHVPCITFRVGCICFNPQQAITHT